LDLDRAGRAMAYFNRAVEVLIGAAGMPAA
jgi:hypothetical protein